MKKMMRNISLSLAFSLMLSGVALATTEPQMEEPQMASFETVDINEDGLITQNEAEEAKISTDVFQSADINKDNMLDKAEYASIVTE